MNLCGFTQAAIRNMAYMTADVYWLLRPAPTAPGGNRDAADELADLCAEVVVERSSAITWPEVDA